MPSNLAAAIAFSVVLGALPNPTLFGCIVEERTGKPLQDCDVHLSGLYRLAGTDAAGMFALPDIPPGDHELIVTCPFHDSLRVTIHRTAGSRDTLRLKLRRAQLPPFVSASRLDPTPFPPTPYGRVEVTAVDSTGQPQRGIVVRIPSLQVTGFTDSLGHCSFERVPLGRIAVNARTAVHTPVRDTLDVATGEPTRWLIRARVSPGWAAYEIDLGPYGGAMVRSGGDWRAIDSDGRTTAIWCISPKNVYRN